MKHGEFTVMYRNEPKAELFGWVAQLVEHLTCKHGVMGSIPPWVNDFSAKFWSVYI